jgi:hypothetical protein
MIANLQLNTISIMPNCQLPRIYKRVINLTYPSLKSNEWPSDCGRSASITLYRSHSKLLSSFWFFTRTAKDGACSLQHPILSTSAKDTINKYKSLSCVTHIISDLKSLEQIKKLGGRKVQRFLVDKPDHEVTSIMRRLLHATHGFQIWNLGLVLEGIQMHRGEC